MTISTKRIAVRFNEGVAAPQQEQLLDSLPGVALERRWETLESENIAVVGLRTGIEAFGAGNVVLRANTPHHHFMAEVYINGKLYEKVGNILDSGMPARSFRIKDNAGTTVALVNTQSFNDSRIEPASPYTVPSGSVVLTGRAFIAGNADRSASQGK